uniref:Histidine-containing phosphotransfer protein n=1 Tax=Vitis vinifera TaxID=29760 RepID=A5C6S1_VITVI|nr:hypothetical protein VITISV_031194 [Vitis vinifera]
MEMVQMQRRFVEYATSLLHEGFLDGQFTQLQQLQDESNPDFVVEVLLNDLPIALDQQNVDFKRVDSHVHQLKGSSSSIGPQRVKNVCIAFRNYCEEQNTDACLSCLQQVKQEYSLIKSTLETLFRLEQQILTASGPWSHAQLLYLGFLIGTRVDLLNL